MHAFELQKTIEHFFKEATTFRPFITVVSELAASADTMVQYLPAIAVGGQKLNDSAANLHAFLSGVRKSAPNISQREFFKGLEHFLLALAHLHAAYAKPPGLLDDLKAKVDHFASIYDAFLAHGSGTNALPILLAAQTLKVKYEALVASLKLLESVVGEEDVISAADAPLELWLPENYDLGDFARRLQALQSLYSELCMLFSVSESQHPLRISKIESGSLWARLIGDASVIALMIAFVKGGASWIYRNYTTEGKIEAIPRGVQAIDNLLGLTKRMKEAGLDTSQAEAHIGKSAVAISQNLSVLLSGQKSVTINEFTISGGDGFDKALLNHASLPQLAGPDADAIEGPPAPQ